MSVIIKYTVICISVITLIAFIVVFVGFSDKDVRIDEKAQKQNPPEKINEQYKIYFTFDGNQDQTIDLIKGKAELNMVYSGKSKFTAKLLSPDGTLLTLLADINGPYNRLQEVDVPKTAAYLLDVRTSGEWSLSRE